MVHTPPRRWGTARERVVLKVEFENASAFRSNYLADLPKGGIRVATSMEVGQAILLNITFQGFEDPRQIEAEVRWSHPAGHPEGPAAGLAFVDPSAEAAAWLHDVLDASTQVYILAAPAERVLLLEVEAFLRDVYSQEVRNWAELRDEGEVDVVATDDPAAWLLEVGRSRIALAIMDVDGLPVSGIELYRQVRSNRFSVELPLIVVGAPQNVEPFVSIDDLNLRYLRKPLRFGLLMNTVRVLAASNDP